MEREVSESIMFGISLCLVGSTMVIILVFYSKSLDLRRDFLTDIDSANINSWVSELLDINEYNRPIPCASLYLILKKNEKVISRIDGTIEGKRITKLDDLKDFFGNKYLCEVIENNEQYTITLMEER